jgi:hypothetical protein
LLTIRVHYLKYFNLETKFDVNLLPEVINFIKAFRAPHFPEASHIPKFSKCLKLMTIVMMWVPKQTALSGFRSSAGQNTATEYI